MTPNPRVRDYSGCSLQTRLTRFEHDGLDRTIELSIRVCPHRPRSRLTISGVHAGRNCHRIESSDYSFRKRLAYKASRFVFGLLDEASVEPSKHLSMHSALRVSHMTVGIFRPLSSTGEVEFTGCDCGLRFILPPPLASEIDHRFGAARSA